MSSERLRRAPCVMGRTALACMCVALGWAKAAAAPPSSTLTAPTAPSRIAPAGTPLTSAWAALQRRIDEDQRRQARVPVPVGFRFKPKKTGSLDVRPDLAAAVAADLNHDGRAEVFIASEHAVIVVDFLRGPRVVANVRFPDEAQRRSRQLVGSLRVVGAEVRAQVSAHPYAMTVRWDGAGYSGQRSATGAVGGSSAPALSAGFEFCKDQTWPLHPGRNWFDTGTSGQGVYSMVCRDDLVDAQGHIWSMRASVSEHDVLHVEAQAHCDTTCGTVQAFDIAGAGYAFAVDDLDQNGVPEVLASAATATTDIVTITELSAPPHVVLRRRFGAGVVALLTGDFDGDGKRDAIALVRAGKRLDVWSLQ